MFLFLSFCSSKLLERYEKESMYMSVLDDKTMRETIKKDKSAFVLFHADHQRISDTCYLRYLSIAEKYQDKASFYVVPASGGQDVARTYDVVGYPFLMHFRYGTKTGTHLGLYSYDSIERFIANHTKYQATVMEPTQDLYAEILDLFPESTAICVVIAKEDSEFGKVVSNLIDELASHMQFVHIKDEEKAKELGFKAPSLGIIRSDDKQYTEYNGDINVDDMFVWVMHAAIPKFRRLTYSRIFSHDGATLDSVIAFISQNTGDNNQELNAFKTLSKISNDSPWIGCYYVYLEEDKAFVNLLGAKAGSIGFIKSNYSYISYALMDINESESAMTKFLDDKLEMQTVPVPPALYGDIQVVTEPSFEGLLSNEKPFVVMFGSAFCKKCITLKQAYFDAAHTLRRNNASSIFGYWDVTEATPSFQKDMDIGVPSIYLFPTSNITDGRFYNGPRDYLSIIEWYSVNIDEGNASDDIVRKELNPQFDEI